MSTPNNDPKLASIKTYILIAFIFNIIAIIGFALGALSQILFYVTFASYIDYFGNRIVPSSGLIIAGVVYLVIAVLAVLVFMRVRKMYNAVNHGDIVTLKATNNMLWAVLALIFAGVIPGIMLLISFGPINELGQPSGANYPPPPPPQ